MSINYNGVSNESALQILEMIHNGDDTLELIVKKLGAGNVITTLNHLYRGAPEEHRLLSMNSNGRFTINGNFHAFWSSEIRHWLIRNNYKV